MPRTDEATSFFYAVYAAVQEIPAGKVTSYGHIARLIGTPERPRQVGTCLKHLPSEPSEPSSDPRITATRPYHAGNVPWQRVVNGKGVISPRSHPSGAANQALALRAEGVTVTTGRLGELGVDLAAHGWFPRQLPSSVAAGVEPDDDSGEDGGRLGS